MQVGTVVISRYQSSQGIELAARHLQSYPADPFIDQPYGEAENKYMLWVHCIFIAYMLLGLNTVCDAYFTGALDVMVERWQIAPDVAGATFMAAGGSAPELFTSLIGAFYESDVGFSTIVGSAVFNVLFVIGLCGWVAKEPIALSWWPLFRDCNFYILGLLLLAFCAADQNIEFWEALILFLFYVLYCTMMVYNERLETFFQSILDRRKAKKGQLDEKDTAATAKLGQVAPAPDSVCEAPCPGSTAPTIAVHQIGKGATEGGDLRVATEGDEAPTAVAEVGPEQTPEAVGSSTRPSVSTNASQGARLLPVEKLAPDTQSGWDSDVEVIAVPETRSDASPKKAPGEGSGKIAFENKEEEAKEEKQPEDDPEKESEEEEDPVEELLKLPEGTLDRIFWSLSLPVYVSLYYTLPNPKRPSIFPCFHGCEGDKAFIRCFGTSLLWIALFSYFLVWWVTIAGEVIHVDITLMAFTLLAAGTSIPDAVSSMAVARKGEGDMAVSSSIGSNIFDILVGLPVPWMIKIALVNQFKDTVTISSPNLIFYVLILLFMVFAVIVSIHFLGWVLNRTLGVCMAGLYFIFLISAIVVEKKFPEGLIQ